jgi:hypothetical protein
VVTSVESWTDVFVGKSTTGSSLMGSYPMSKLMQILVTRQMKDELVGESNRTLAFDCLVHTAIKLDQGVNVFSLTPGWVSTSIQDPIEHSIGALLSFIYRPFIAFLKFCLAKTPRKGAETIVYCAIEPTLQQSRDVYFQSVHVEFSVHIDIGVNVCCRIY